MAEPPARVEGSAAGNPISLLAPWELALATELPSGVYPEPTDSASA